MFGKKKKDENTEKESEKQKSEEEDIKEKISKGWIKCHFMFEVIGKPAEYIEEILKKLMDILEKEKGVLVLNKSRKPAQAYEEVLFCAFAETELIVENIKRLFDLVYDYMPSSIEVFEPKDIKLKLADINLVLNEFAVKLHQQDINLKKIQFERDVLFKKLQETKGIKEEEK